MPAELSEVFADIQCNMLPYQARRFFLHDGHHGNWIKFVIVKSGRGADIAELWDSIDYLTVRGMIADLALERGIVCNLPSED